MIRVVLYSFRPEAASTLAGPLEALGALLRSRKSTVRAIDEAAGSIAAAAESLAQSTLSVPAAEWEALLRRAAARDPESRIETGGMSLETETIRRLAALCDRQAQLGRFLERAAESGLTVLRQVLTDGE